MGGDLYSTVLSAMGREELEKEVEKKISDFHGLLTLEVALKLIAREKGLYKDEDKEVKIKEIIAGMRRITLRARIMSIDKEMSYPSGKKARTIIIRDDTGHVPLTLWNNDLSLLSQLKVGDEIIIKSAYEKSGSLSLGYKGTLEIANAAPYSSLSDIENNSFVNVRAFISAVEGKKEYEKNGKKYSYFSFFVSDSAISRRCVLWGVPDFQKMAAGNEIIIQNGSVRNNEIHINGRTRLLVRRPEDTVSGRLADMHVEHGLLLMNIGSRVLAMNRENALKFFGIDVSDDISIETIVTLKKESMLNRNVYIRCKEQNGEAIMLS